MAISLFIAARQSDFQHFYRVFYIDLVFRENQRRSLERRDGQLLQRTHLTRLHIGFGFDAIHQ